MSQIVLPPPPPELPPELPLSLPSLLPSPLPSAAKTAAPEAEPAAEAAPQAADLRYLRYLPAIYQDEPSILLDYLEPFSDWFDSLRELLARIDTYLSPAMTPTSEGFLSWLAGWVALTLDEEWDEDQRRRLMQEAVELYRWRGTATGLRRYLELYTGQPAECIELHEGQWPSGMQIGVASRIGGFSDDSGPRPAPARVERVRRRQPTATRDYYVLTDQETVRYLPVETVEAVEFAGDTVLLRLAGGAAPIPCPLRGFTRRNALPQARYDLALPPAEVALGGPRVQPRLQYDGDGCCVTTEPRAYCFIVRLLLPPAEYARYSEPQRLNKLKTIIELEKPAHTLCYLDLQRRSRTARLVPMQIGVTSTVGLDTVVPHARRQCARQGAEARSSGKEQ